MSQEISSSWIGSHFVRDQVDGKSSLRCLANGCDKYYSRNTSHIVLKRHYSKAHGETLDNRKKTTFLFHDEAHIDALIKLVVKQRLSYLLVETDEFKNYSSFLNRNKPLISRHEVSNIITNKTATLRNDIVIKLEGAESVALTFDIWSARKCSRGFGVVTAHYIEKPMDLKSVVLYFEHIPYPHDSKTIQDVLYSVVDTFRLRNKVIAITSDNGGANIPAVSSLNEIMNLGENRHNLGFVHFRCVAHIINLAVHEALKRIKPLVKEIKEVVITIRSSTKRTEHFMATQARMIEESRGELPSNPLNLKEDVDTRWNSTYLMLERVLLLKDALVEEMEQSRELQQYSGIDWDKLREVLLFLKPFFDVTVELSGEKYPTVSLVTTLMPKMIGHAQSYRDHAYLGQASSALYDKLDWYTQFTDKPIVVLATVLDPRFKDSFLPEEACIIAKNLLNSFVADMDSSLDSLDSQDSQQSEDSIYCVISQHRQSHSLSLPSITEDIYIDFSADEVGRYLASQREGKVTNPLLYWQANMKTYPKLAKLARLVLPIQATSVPSERIFSLAGLVDTPRRNSLSGESFAGNILLNSWLDHLDYEV